jgi:hypothetical protein
VAAEIASNPLLMLVAVTRDLRLLRPELSEDPNLPQVSITGLSTPRLCGTGDMPMRQPTRRLPGLPRSPGRHQCSA